MIYSDLSATLADSRQHASSVTQLLMIDKLALMIADTLSEYHRFNRDAFLTKARFGYGVPLDNRLEKQ